MTRVTRRFACRVPVLLLALALLVAPVYPLSAESENRDGGAWFPVASPPEFTVVPAQTFADGKILVSIRPPLIYDPYSGEWTAGASHPDFEGLPTWNPTRAAPLADGRILAFGGGYAAGISPGSTGTSNRSAIYDPQQRSWRDISAMNFTRYDPGVAELQDRTVLATGGRYGSGISGSSGWYVTETAERFLPETEEWVEIAPMNESRRLHETIALEDGRVVVIGGHGAMFHPAAAIEIYDPQADAWEIIAQLPDRLLGHTATLLGDGMILIAGGSSSVTSTPFGVPLADTFILDPSTGDMIQVDPMTVARTAHQATMLPGGNVLVTGGRAPGEDGDVRTNSTEIYDVATGTWTTGPALSRARENHYSISLIGESQGAAALVYGGIDGSSDDLWAEVFYPAKPGIADRQPPPAIDLPSHRYFPQTGHYLSHGFKDFWYASGGLPVFGYPLTTEFDAYNPERDEPRTSQYFERQRFEFHPEHAGTPYEVLLGRLGYAEAFERGLFATEAFEPVDDSTLDVDCHYFPETSQAACGEFLNYWRSFGLDFGDPGVSFRESLALFGFPISREFTDPTNGLTMQYFERARFERHPENPEAYRVLLGRLGADIVEQRDW